MMWGTTFQDRLNELLQREPFQPFLIELDNGERFQVGRREALWYQGGEDAVYFGDNGALDFIRCQGVRSIVALVPESAGS